MSDDDQPYGDDKMWVVTCVDPMGYTRYIAQRKTWDGFTECWDWGPTSSVVLTPYRAVAQACVDRLNREHAIKRKTNPAAHPTPIHYEAVALDVKAWAAAVALNEGDREDHPTQALRDLMAKEGDPWR